jgi:glycine cleavage system H lipoate-binding protein
MSTEDKLVHNAWSPLSGEVVLVNDRLEKTPDLPHQDPVTHGWLVRILPSNLELELPALTVANPQLRTP